MQLKLRRKMKNSSNHMRPYWKKMIAGSKQKLKVAKNEQNAFNYMEIRAFKDLLFISATTRRPYSGN